MKDARGHGSDPRGANVVPLAAHQGGVDAMVERLRAGVTPDTSGATQSPKWLQWFGRRAKRERREDQNASA